MDYEKKYDEAIERAKGLVDFCSDNELKTLEFVFPELKESEDEKIRKGLIDFVNQYGDNFYGQISKEYAIAWLEKQSGHSVSPLFTFEDVLTIQCAMAYAKFQDRELDVALKKLHDKVYDAYHDSKNHHIESQDGLKGEQIPANSAKTCKDEQKPAENEELTEFDKAVGVSIGTWNPKSPEQIQSVKAVSKKLLKLAKKQINDEQKPVEWSKDDEQYLLICKNALSKYQVSDKWDAGIISRWLEERLKSLRPQSTWKPSDEQMQCLYDAIEYYQTNGYPATKLKELHEQMQKIYKL